MTLADVSKGACVTIENVCAEQTLADRLRALGIAQGERVRLVKISVRKKVFYICTDYSLTALGAEAARLIEVKA